MTDLLDPPTAPDRPWPEARSEPLPPPDAPGRWLIAALLLGAASVHLAMAPSHMGESSLEGAGFLAAAWVQIGLALVLVVRPARWALLATAGTSIAFVGVWAVSRTAGLPVGVHSGHAETVTVIDAATVALETLAALLATTLLLRPRAPFGRSSTLALVGAFGALALTSAVLASPSARDHAASSHGEHHGGDVAAADHHDDATAGAVDGAESHAHGVEPLTSAEMVALAGQLAATVPLMQQYPTLADAEAAGWTRAGPFSPGLGVHYRGPQYQLNPDGLMDPEDLAAPMLIFDGLGPDAPLAGFMYLAYGASADPEGFAGPNDHWHYHEHVCVVFEPDGTIATPFGADLPDLTEQICTAAGGSWIDNTGYMVHVWNVPGYESPDGLFAELNPALTCPDGTYYRIPTAELGDRTSTCLSA